MTDHGIVHDDQVDEMPHLQATLIAALTIVAATSGPITSIGKLDADAVIGRLDMRRQLRAQRLVVEIGMQVGQDRALGLDALDPGERLGQAEMARMRRVAQRVDDPDVEPGQRRGAFGRQVAEVAGIGEAAEAEAERGDVAVLLQDGQGGDRAALPRRSSPAVPGAIAVLGDDRRIFAAGRRREAIAEAVAQRPARSARRHRRRPAGACCTNSAAQIVDAVGVVGVLVGDTARRRAIGTSASSSCSRRSGEVSTSTRVDAVGPLRARPAARSAAAGSSDCSGSQAPQPSAGRGTPSDEPQPRIVKLSCVMPSCCGAPAAAPCRTAGRSSRWSGARSRSASRRATSASTLAVSTT